MCALRVVKVLSLATAMALTAAVTAPAATLGLTDPGTVAESPAQTSVEAEAGQGLWGCGACLVGAGIIASGGLIAVYAFINNPMAPFIVSTCGMACFE